MNLNDQNPLQCEVCGEKEPCIIHTVYQNGVYRGRCTNCLLNENRERFCPICFIATNELSERTTCLKCNSMAHVACLRPSQSSSSLPPLESAFTCPSCTDPTFTFFPKSYVIIDICNLSRSSALALVSAAKIAADILEHAEAQLKEEDLKMMFAAREARIKAKDILAILQSAFSQRLRHMHVTRNNNNS